MKKRKWVIGSSLVILGMITSGLAASVAWFVAEKNTFNADVDGSVVEEYFHCGSGTQNDPFVITRPIHYYHLVEFFQRKTVLPISGSSVRFGTDYLYFQIGYNLDNDSTNGLEVYTYNNDGSWAETYGKTLNMAYFSGENAVMPIGTSECPFFGSFNGGGNADPDKSVVVENLNVKSSEEVVVHGGGSTKTTRYTSDVGMFGYVADDDDPAVTNKYNTSIHDIVVNNLTIDLTGAVKGKNAVDASGVQHETAHNNDVHVGYIAGHVHTYTSYNATGTVNSKPLYNVYVNNAKILGGYDGARCNFGYVGYADTIDGEQGSDIDLTEIISELEEESGGGGQGDDWGGSFNFKEFNNRLYYYLNNTTMTIPDLDNGQTGKNLIYRNYYWYKDRSDDFKFSLYRNPGSNETSATKNRGNTTYYANDPNEAQVVYNLAGKYNGSWTTATSSSMKKQHTINIPGTIQPLIIDENYATLSKNTGYILGGNKAPTANSNGQNSIVPYVVSSSYHTRFLNNSTNDTAISDYNVYKNIGSFVGYDKTKLEIFTVKKNAAYSASNYVLIKDEMAGYNSGHTPANSNISSYTKNDTTTPTALGLTKYNSSRTTLDGILSDSDYIHGMHFRGSASDAASVYINTTNTLTASNVTLNGQEYASYTFPTSCVDFNLKTAGKINFFSGSYFYQTTDGVNSTNSFMSLWKVNRGANNALSSVQQIKRIFKSNDESAAEPYIYDYNGSTTPADSTLVFDVRFLNNAPPVKNALYYFEVPVNAGEYAIGTADNSAGGAYLMYLDIGTSGSESTTTYDQDNKISQDTIFTQMEYLSEGYVINSCFNIGFVVPNGSSKNNFYVMVSRNDDVFDVTVINTTGNDFTLYVLLVDNNDDPDDTYPYTYTLKYNTGAKSQEYGTSEVWTGTSGGTALVKQTS